MGHHENWLTSTSRNVLVARNKHRKNVASFGDDDTPPDASIQAGMGVFSNSGVLPTTINDPSSVPESPPDQEGVGTIAPNQPARALGTVQSPGVPASPGFAVTLGQNTSPTTTNDPVALNQAVVDAGASAMSSAGQSSSAYVQGATLANQGVSGPGLASALAAQPPAAQTAFNAGVALANGAAKTTPPPGLSPSATAGFLTAHGLVGAPPAVQGAVAGSLAQTPAVKTGLIAGITSVKKSWWRRLLDWLHL